MRTGTLQTEDPIVQRLNSVADTHPDLRAAARLYEAILPLIRDADIHVPPLRFDQAKIRSFLEKGVPLLSGLALEVEFRELEVLMLRLIRAIESMDASGKKGGGWKSWLRTTHIDAEPDNCLLKAAAAGIRQSYEDGRLDLGEILRGAASGNHGVLSERAANLQLDCELLWTLAQNTLKATLNMCRREIAPQIDGLQWDKGYCFICGSRATLGELQDNDQVKHLRCGQCGADWHFNRLQCLHCGNVDHETQQSLYLDGSDSRRIEACDLCHGYLKVIASFAPTPPEMLAVEDLATLHLDYIAQQRGYAKAGVSNTINT
jgi:Protein involved in formate dehydrogenase formation